MRGEVEHHLKLQHGTNPIVEDLQDFGKRLLIAIMEQKDGARAVAIVTRPSYGTTLGWQVGLPTEDATPHLCLLHTHWG